MKKMKIYAMLVFLVLMTSCEKYNQNEAETASVENGEADGNIALYLDSCQQERISVGIFQADQKVKTFHLQANDASCPSIKMSLPTGVYQLVVIAHNGDGNCTLSSPQKITFPKNKVTDTFFRYDTLQVTDEKSTVQKNLTLKRAVGKFQLHIADTIPDEVQQFKFYYTGGSSTFNAVTGYGCVNSRQTEYRPVQSGVSDYTVYTFPHKDSEHIKMTITAQDEDGKEITTHAIDQVPIQMNETTLCSGDFFESSDGASSSNTEFSFTFSEEWKDNIHVPFFHKSR